MNAPLAVALAVALVLVLLRAWFGRRGYSVTLEVVVKTPPPRMPKPRPGNVMIPVQLRHDFFVMAQQGLAGVTRVESVGDGSWTLMVDQQNPQPE